MGGGRGRRRSRDDVAVEPMMVDAGVEEGWRVPGCVVVDVAVEPMMVDAGVEEDWRVPGCVVVGRRGRRRSRTPPPNFFFILLLSRSFCKVLG